MRNRTTVALGLLVQAALLSAGTGTAQTATDRHAFMPFQVMTPEDLTAAKIRGTGCVWISADDRSIRFAASHDRAVVKLRGAFRSLKPASGAADMFPFTYDRWSAAGIEIKIVKGNLLDLPEGKAPLNSAILEASVAGKSARHVGTLDCGS
jgi:hypothetical protein